MSRTWADHRDLIGSDTLDPGPATNDSGFFHQRKYIARRSGIDGQFGDIDVPVLTGHIGMTLKPPADKYGAVTKLFERKRSIGSAYHRGTETRQSFRDHQHERGRPQRHGLSKQRRDLIAPRAGAVDQQWRFASKIASRHFPGLTRSFYTFDRLAMEKSRTRALRCRVKSAHRSERFRVSIPPAKDSAAAVI
jgi:hypothetical protein